MDSASAAALSPYPLGPLRAPLTDRRLTRAILALVIAAAGIGLARVALSTSHVAAPGAAIRTAGSRAVRIQELPAQAQGAISTAFGATAPAFAPRAVPHGWRMSGGGVTAQLSPAAVRLRTRGGSVGLSTRAIGRAGRLTALGRATTSAHHNRISYRYPGVREWFAAGPMGIEQGFLLARRPTGRSGPVTISLGVTGSLHARPGGGTMAFVSAAGVPALRFSGLVAVDADGHRLPATFALARGRLVLRVADHRARYPVRIDPFIQQGSALIASGETGAGVFGYHVALSQDGSTAIVGGWGDTQNAGAAWVFTVSGGVWSEQTKLTGADESGDAGFGYSVALSSDGDTALVGGPLDNNDTGAVWVFSRTDGAWTEQQKLTAAGENGSGNFGHSVAVSSDGTTALVGAPLDANNIGAAWIFSKSGDTWTQQAELVPTGEDGAGQFGDSVSLSGNGNTAVVGAPSDSASHGAAWVFIGSGGTWSQEAELGATGETGPGQFGFSVALSQDGSTVLAGAPGDTNSQGAAWAFTASDGTWSQQAKLVGDCTTDCASQGTGESGAGNFGSSVALSQTGDAALVGGYDDGQQLGAAWAFSVSGGKWTHQGNKLAGRCTTQCSVDNEPAFGVSVSLSGDGGTALIGAPFDSGDRGAAWVFTEAADPPTASITTPQDNATYAIGQVVDADYTCRSGAGASLDAGAAGCSGTVADGLQIDTSTPGQHRFTVTAADTDGQTATATSTYTVTALPGAGGAAGGGAGDAGGGSAPSSASYSGGSAGSVGTRTGAGASPGGGGGRSTVNGSSTSHTGKVTPCPATTGRPKTRAATARMPVSCRAGGAGATVKATLTVTTTQAVATRKGKHRTVKKSVTVGRATVRLSPGQHRQLVISLSAAGQRLLAKEHRLRARLTITEGSHVISARTVTFISKGATKHKRTRRT